MIMDKQNIVFYCDGGFLLDSSTGGAGVHGYIYKGMSEKQENILGKWTPTPDGYVEREEGVESVDIINFIDIIKGLDGVTSSSNTELNAINKALEWLEGYDTEIESVLILSDSKNVIQGITEWIHGWRKRDWRTSTGEPVKFVELWKEVDGRISRLTKDRDIKLNFKWIKGHDGNLGNEKADNLATRGILLNKNADVKLHVTLSEFKGYWTPPSKLKAHRLLDGPRLYTSTYSREDDSTGPTIYYIGSHGAKERLAEEQGKVYPCNYLSVIRMPEPDPVISKMDELVSTLEESRGGIKGTLVTYNLQNLLTARFYSEVMDDGLTFTERKLKPITVNTAIGAPLAEEIFPVGRAFRLVDYCSIVKNRLTKIDTATDIKRESIIDEFFDKTEKKDGTAEFKIRKDITSATKSIKVDAEFSTSSTDINTELFKRKVTLILGIDTPSRNVLSALAKEVEAMDIVSWRDSPNSVRYGVYIKLSTGHDGLWIKYDSNLIIKT